MPPDKEEGHETDQCEGDPILRPHGVLETARGQRQLCRCGAGRHCFTALSRVLGRPLSRDPPEADPGRARSLAADGPHRDGGGGGGRVRGQGEVPPPPRGGDSPCPGHPGQAAAGAVRLVHEGVRFQSGRPQQFHPLPKNHYFFTFSSYLNGFCKHFLM